MTDVFLPQKGRGMLRTYWWLVVVLTLVTLAAAAVVAATRPVSYTSVGQVVVTPEPTDGAPILPVMGTEREVATSGDVAAVAADRLGVSTTDARQGLSVAVIVETNVLEISYTSSSASGALEGASAFAEAYVDYRNSDAGARVTQVITAPRLDEAGSGGNYPIILGLGLLAGLALGAVACWLWDRLSGRVRDAKELEERSGMPVLGFVPASDSGPSTLLPGERARAAIGYVVARFSTLSGSRRRGLSIVVTSLRHGMGTTTVAANVAIALAAHGRDVVLVGADRGSARLPEGLGLSAGPGLVQVLDGAVSVGQALQATAYPRLSALPAGEGSPLVDVNLDDLQLILGQLGSKGLVVIDAPALLESAETLSLVGQAHEVVVVADLRSTTRGDVDAVTELLAGVPRRPAGWVLNEPDRRRKVRHVNRPDSPPPPTGRDQVSGPSARAFS